MNIDGFQRYLEQILGGLCRDESTVKVAMNDRGVVVAVIRLSAADRDALNQFDALMGLRAIAACCGMRQEQWTVDLRPSASVVEMESLTSEHLIMVRSHTTAEEPAAKAAVKRVRRSRGASVPSR